MKELFDVTSMSILSIVLVCLCKKETCDVMYV